MKKSRLTDRRPVFECIYILLLVTLWIAGLTCNATGDDHRKSPSLSFIDRKTKPYDATALLLASQVDCNVMNRPAIYLVNDSTTSGNDVTSIVAIGTIRTGSEVRLVTPYNDNDEYILVTRSEASPSAMVAVSKWLDQVAESKALVRITGIYHPGGKIAIHDARDAYDPLPVELAMLNACNEFRARMDREPYVWSNDLCRTARLQTIWMLSHGMHHGSWGVGENIAYGQQTVNGVTNVWENSSGHRANMLGGYQAFGASHARTRSGTPYWTQQFR